MAAFSSRRTRNAVRHGALGLALALPLVAGLPTQAQSEAAGTERDETQLEDVQGDGLSGEPGAAEPIEVVPAPASGPVAEPIPETSEQARVLITEVIIEGIDGHPEQERLELAAYDAMAVRPGSRVTRDELKLDLDAIYATGWFSDVRIEPINGPLGVQLVVQVMPNPVLSKVVLEPEDSYIEPQVIEDTFSADYGRTLNLSELQLRMKELQKWYADQGYSLARVSGPTRVSPDGVVELKVLIGTVAGVEVKFVNKEGEDTNEKGEPLKGKTRPWVVSREISLKPGEPFNRTQLEGDIRRLYATSLFSDVKVTLKPVTGEPGAITIVLGIVEQSTGSLSGGLGYSQSQGVFGQVQLSDSNLFGRAWNLALNITYGQFGGLANLTFSDPWIKGDSHRTSFRTSLFLSREVPQVFQSQNDGDIRTLEGYEDNGSRNAYSINSDNNPADSKFDNVAEAGNEFPNVSWFDYEGDSVALQRVGGNVIFARPLNGGDPFKRVPWSVLAGLNLQNVRPINFSGDTRPYGIPNDRFRDGKIPDDEIICVAFNCANENNLASVRLAASYNNLNDARNPTSGNFFTVSTEQYVSVGENSPTFNRVRGTYTHFIPVRWLKLFKGCRPKEGEPENCPQALAFQFKAGTVLGQLPPYEAFCLGGSNSVRGWFDCDLAVGRSFGEATIEYRFPLISIFAGEVFLDAGTDFGSQGNVPGRPGDLLDKPGSGVSPGIGVIMTTPVGPLRLEVASQNFTDEYRFNLGVGWKF
ncbi:BamA/TamA family outer membrane protein [Synechococcus sp. NOUM97013]|uniref:BamA/TamA family outer membrane protein n=1 Tax=Synechococcus sp. NOUM97013 TaxID=1442555 RepID=UPI001644ED7C|nr:BamA/TamA family outer membrane protein [Synechococcus sp. NOUM97013]QNI74347.1 outer membrane protein insertion porin family [Synechococcus sp. NOUM97013]